MLLVASNYRAFNYYSVGTRENHEISIKITGDPAEIRTEYLPNTILEPCL
jgi:hypothetical protein